VHKSPAGERATARTGDVLLTYRPDFYNRLIEIGQRQRYPRRPDLTRWSHAALVIDDDGELAEALPNGVRRTHIERYSDVEYVIVRTHVDEHDRPQVTEFAAASVGIKYDWVTVVSVTLALLTGMSLSFSLENQLICSGFVAEALTRAGYIFHRSPSHMTPADLAWFFRVEWDSASAQSAKLTMPRRRARARRAGVSSRGRTTSGRRQASG
jgi:hypothetical protein